MQTIKLNNGVEMPMLGFGTFLIGGEECSKTVENAIGDEVEHCQQVSRNAMTKHFRRKRRRE